MVRGTADGATSKRCDAGAVVEYDYNDSLVLPALVETKPVSGISTEYYVDEAMNIVKVVHVRDNTELAGFEYERDGKNRITEVREYRGGQLKATTTYAYGNGNLSSNDLDASTNVDPTKLYWNWLGSTFSAALADSDPNRLVLEQRQAEGEDDFSYRKEYFYDPGGNP